MGWDTLHPELDFILNLKRLLLGTWREDQGVGAPAAHAHMSELPRLLLLWFLSFFVSPGLLRYFFAWICLILGPLGIYFLTKRLLPRRLNLSIRKRAAFIAALSYLCNLGTVQHFHVFFEMFATQYAALPFLMLTAVRAVSLSRAGDYACFFFLAAISAPMAYAPHLWWAFFIGFAVWLFTWAFLENSLIKARRAALLLGLSTAANAYWLLPHLHYVFSGRGAQVALSKIHSLFSPEAFLHNAAYGTLRNLLLLRNYLFDWLYFDSFQGKFKMLLWEWFRQLQNWELFALALAGTSLLGIPLSRRARLYPLFAYFSVMLLCAFMLINANPPFAWIFRRLQENYPMFAEGLRFPFTKFSILWMVGLSLFLSEALAVMFKFCVALTRPWGRIPVECTFVLIATAIVGYGAPLFKGGLFSPAITTPLPDHYRQLFAFMRTQPQQARAVLFPLHTLQGWEYHSWGFQGAGFLWFGMPQPLLTRDFDRWSRHNEAFYREAVAALYACPPLPADLDPAVSNCYKRCARKLNRILQKYETTFVLIDKSIIDPQNRSAHSLLRFRESELMLKLTSWVKIFERGPLSVWRKKEGRGSPSSFISVPPYYRRALVPGEFLLSDPAYDHLGDYIQAQTGGEGTVRSFPFADLMREELTHWSLRSSTGGAKKLSFPRRIELSGGKGGSLIEFPGFKPGEGVPFLIQFRRRGKDLVLQVLPAYRLHFAGRNVRPHALLRMRIQLPRKGKGDFWLAALGRLLRIPATTAQRRVFSSFRVSERIEIAILSSPLLPSVRPAIPVYKQRVWRCRYQEGVSRQRTPRTRTGRLRTSWGQIPICLRVPIKARDREDMLLISLPIRGAQSVLSHACLKLVGRDQKNCGVYRIENPEDTHSSPHLDLLAMGYPASQAAYLELEAYVLNKRRRRARTFPVPPPEIRWKESLFRFSVGGAIWRRIMRPRPVSAAQPIKDVVLSLTLGEHMPLVFHRIGKATCFRANAKYSCRRPSILGSFPALFEAKQGAVYAEPLTFPFLNPNMSALIHIRGDKLHGRGLKFVVGDQNHLAPLDLQHLAHRRGFEDLLRIPSRPAYRGSALLLIIQNRSIGGIPSINKLEHISLFDAPFDWAARISIPPRSEPISDGKLKNAAALIEARRLGGTHYSALVYVQSSSGKAPALITLAQGYEQGWQAWGIPHASAPLVPLVWIVPWLMGERLEHVTFNGWANGWLLPKEAQGEWRIEMVYVPQYLQWIGFFVFVVALLQVVGRLCALRVIWRT